MAFDGFVISNMVYELNHTIAGGRITKISQPEKDELMIVIKNKEQYKLMISASASLPLIYLTEKQKQNPMTAPNFCMLLRKHLNSARIISITQPEFERILKFEIEHLDELGDLRTKYLIVELMGKHSNIIFCDENNRIVDSIKHISGFVSSVREVLPGREYFIPKTMDKKNPCTVSQEEFTNTILAKPVELHKAIYTSLTGISPLLANEICCRAELDSGSSTAALSSEDKHRLYQKLNELIKLTAAGTYEPNIVYQGEVPLEFSSVPLTCYDGLDMGHVEKYTNISSLLEDYYASKNTLTRIHQKSADLRRIVATAIERTTKKYDLQLKQLKDTQKRNQFKIYGELLTTYGYSAKSGAKELTVPNYYTNEEITIPLNHEITALENAKQYFDRYNKLKRTYEALSKFIIETKEEIDHLDSIRTSLDIAVEEEDLLELREELMEFGYIKRHYATNKGKYNTNSNKNSAGTKSKADKPRKKTKITSKPFHYLSSDGYHMYVGKNNFQNDELTFQFASGADWWFHAKGIPGSHVIVKLQGTSMPDRVFEEAGSLAAYYSKNRESDKVEIDYIERKKIKKPNGAKPGFVVYDSNYSMIATPNIRTLTLIEK